MPTNSTVTLQEKIKELVSSPSAPFPVKKMGYMKLRRSIIPDSETVRVVYHLDKTTHDLLTIKALQMQLTIDELLRMLSWLVVSE